MAAWRPNIIVPRRQLCSVGLGVVPPVHACKFETELDAHSAVDLPTRIQHAISMVAQILSVPVQKKVPILALPRSVIAAKKSSGLRPVIVAAAVVWAASAPFLFPILHSRILKVGQSVAVIALELAHTGKAPLGSLAPTFVFRVCRIPQLSTGPTPDADVTNSTMLANISPHCFPKAQHKVRVTFKWRASARKQNVVGPQ
mmetsp:Transcript_39474/g.54819  ORF Transcript_39474/g.54819 Transcript_39474/m.54819 type:complete len:200 (+) Transcript_39474:779-1378(+)